MPSFPLPDPSTWFTNVLINAGLIKTNIIDPLNTAPRGLLGDSTTGGAVTLSTTSAFASAASVTFTLTDTRRVRIESQTTYTLAAGVAGRYTTRAGYNTGSSPSIGSFIAVGQGFVSVGSVAGQLSGGSDGSALLTAGTYTAYVSVQRGSGGSATDTAGAYYVAVYDEGDS